MPWPFAISPALQAKLGPSRRRIESLHHAEKLIGEFVRSHCDPPKICEFAEKRSIRLRWSDRTF